MNDNTTPREAIAHILDNSYRSNHAMYLDEHDDAADAVIAHLWQRAESPEVVKAVAQGTATAHGYGDMETTMHPIAINVYKSEAKRQIAATLTALLGPNPNEQEAE